jgi:hypothetical protein
MGSEVMVHRERTLALAGLSWALAGCPPRDTTIRISARGVSYLTQSCACAKDGADAGTSDASLPDTACGCEVGDHIVPEKGAPLQARLYVATVSDFRIRDGSKCMTLSPCGRGGLANAPTACLAKTLNQALDGALPNGLTFDGLKSPVDVLLFMGIYQPDPDSTDAESCSLGRLVACAGLSEPLGGGDFDISCASCQGGGRGAAGRDNGPCPRDPRDKTSCFLQTCYGVLAKSDFQ